MANADDARARFAVGIAQHLTAPLAAGVTLRHVTRNEVRAAAESLFRADARPAARLDALYSVEQGAQLADLAAVQSEPLMHCIMIEREGELIGAYWGQQHPGGRYYMINSVFRPDVRRKGLYRALLPRVVAAAAAAGFSEVYSRHRVDNNAVLVPKLEAGFVICGFEIEPRFGLLVHLRRYLIEGLDHAFHYRIDGTYAAELRDKNVLPSA